MLLFIIVQYVSCLEFGVWIQDCSNKHFLYKQHGSEDKPSTGDTLLGEAWFLLPEILDMWVIGSIETYHCNTHDPRHGRNTQGIESGREESDQR